ncbi:DNA polymerase III subunit beta [Heyndrickxia sp. NPDC080065]|uniref:DNA polymerase III subunit beta n=1 Tax=Heyndrickxia sp. NPDC080065 TaxID=3390568 RepID=UPI003CFDABBC
MEFIINSENFNEAISEVSKAVSTKTPLQILTGIKVTASSDCLTLTGSNSDIIIEKSIPLMKDGVKIIEIVHEGSVVIPAKFLSEIVKKLPGKIHLKVNDNHLITIQSNEIVTSLNGLNSQEYPRIPKINKNYDLKIHGNELTEIIKQTVFAASKSEMKPVLTGVHMSFSKDKLTCVATNSHRLAMRERMIQSNIQCSIVVPSTSLNELLKLTEFELSEIKLFITENYIVFQSDSTTLYSRLIEGVYPNTSGLIPTDVKTTITLNTKQFLKGIDRACLFASEWRNNNVNLSIIEGSKLKISSNSSEVGKIEEIQTLKEITGQDELYISLDGSFLKDALKVIREEEIKISFSGSMRPILIEPVGNPTYLQLISPVRSY